MNISTVGTTGIHACGDGATKEFDSKPVEKSIMNINIEKKQENTIMMND